MVRTRIRVTGTVQGVGFRPFVYRAAVELGLAGSVGNDSDGVLIDVEGDPAVIAELGRRLTDEAPPLARVRTITTEAVAPTGMRSFRIIETDAGGEPNAAVSVDTATCAACLAEAADANDRRFRYPFTNCTDCGPRYTIVRSIPYDRPATTMADFVMCARCQAEYDDPADRRFHAQPNACPDCGPTLTWRLPSGEPAAGGEQALDAAVAALRASGVVAVKGVGGFHLAVDATSPDAVAELRRRKHRDDKPFAVLVADLAAAGRIATIDPDAAGELNSARRPIVLLPYRAGTLAPQVAPGLAEIGVLLPYTPLHHALVHGVGRPLVLTSGNLSDDPIAHESADAVERLGPMVDGILDHDRPIHIRCDDSVARAAFGAVQLLRRSRGYAPEPMALPVAATRHVLAVGAELKNTVAVAKGSTVVASHHIGDLEHLATYRSFRQAIDHLCGLYRVEPAMVACDLHPEYLSTKFAEELDLPVVRVQHHHAHVAACMVEHGRIDPVLGVAFDGIGFGADATLWGGEFLVADLTGFERVAHLRPAPLPGGVAAIREPWRMAAVWAGADAVSGVDAARMAAVVDLGGRPGTAVTTSVGRLFDAVAALLGGRLTVSYEGQAAMELEAWARSCPRRWAGGDDGLVRTDGNELDPRPLVATLVADHRRGVDRAELAAAFHREFGRGTATLAARLAADRRLDTVVLTGGVFQNALLSSIVTDALTAHGLHVLVHARIPPNDGGISLGQAAVAAARSVA